MINFALINGRANLACDIQAPSADDSVALVLWYKDDSLAPIYTVDARKVSSLDKAKISVDEQYAAAHAARQLEVASLRQEDEGEYRCRVDFKRGRTVNTIIALRITIPPADLAVYLVPPPDRPGPLVRVAAGSQQTSPAGQTGQLIGPFDEGAQLELLCVAHGGRPRPQLQWRRDFSVINTTASTAAYLASRPTGGGPGELKADETSALLRIPALSGQHLLSVFTCQASNSNLTSPLQSSVSLDLNLRPQEIALRRIPTAGSAQQSQAEALLVGHTATFECTTSGSRPQATIHWLFQGQRHDTPMSVDQQQTSSKLTLVLQRSFDQSPLTCVAENARIGAAAAASKQTTIKLDIHYPPQLAIKLDSRHSAPEGASQTEVEPAPDSSALQEGNDVYLTCQLDANPRPQKPIVWRFNGRPIVGPPAGGGESSSPSGQAAAALLQSSGGAASLGPSSQHPGPIVISNQSLVLRKVSRKQSGMYTCEAANQHGSNASKPFELVIKHAPVCATDDILVYEAAVGQTVLIDCQVQANPSKSVHFSWFASAGREQNLTDWLQRDAGLDEQVDESRAQLKFKVRDANSFALLKCKAKNEIGLQQRVCLFQVAPAKAPTLRHTCALASGASAPSELQVRCQPSEHLKTNRDDQLAGESSPASNFNWIKNFQAMRQSAQAAADELKSVRVPQMRLVHPPDWLLAELHKQSSPADGRGDGETYELQAYVIVGVQEQLERIKSAVEENRLFQSNPRDIYYVAARQPRARRQQDNDEQRPLADEATTVKRDPAIELTGAFNFTVPNLEPDSRYKLLIYGHNLANKTRDWLVVRGHTAPEPAGFSRQASGAEESRRSKPTGKSFKIFNDDQAGATSNYSSSFAQKSLVMRSEQLDDPGASRPAHTLLEFSAANDSLLDSSLTSSQRANAEHVPHLLSQLHQYRDQALALATQTPLVSIPTTLLVLLVLVYMSGLLIGLLRRGRRRRSASRDSNSSIGSNGGDFSRSAGGPRKCSTDKGKPDEQAAPDGASFASPSHRDRAETNSEQTARTSSSLDGHSPGQMNSQTALLPDEHNAHLALLTQTNNAFNAAAGSIQLDAITLEAAAASHGANWLLAANQRACEHQQQRLLGSLDRRRRVSMLEPSGPAIYLTESPVDGQHFGCQQQLEQPDVCMSRASHFGSVDRRACVPSFYVQQRADEKCYQPLFVSTSTNNSSFESHECIPSVDQSPRQSSKAQRIHPTASSYSSTNECIMSQMDQLLRKRPVAAMRRSAGRQRQPASSGHQQQQQHNHHRVAFNLSDQVCISDEATHSMPPLPPGGSLNDCEHALRALGKCQQDSSSGSNKSATGTNTTADSGHCSPGYTNSINGSTGPARGGSQSFEADSNGVVGAHLPTCQRHQPPEEMYARAGQKASNYEGILRKGSRPSIKSGGQQAIQLTATAADANQVKGLVEFASPSSQESSTLLQSVDSFADHSSASFGVNQPRGLAQEPTDAALLLERNHQMITSFASNGQS